jgi:hypothetical protein
MTDRDRDTTVQLALWVRTIPPRKPGGLLTSWSEADWARLQMLSGAVDRKSLFAYLSIGGMLSSLIVIVGLGAMVALVAYGPWAAVELGVLDPSRPASNIWAVTSACLLFLLAGAMGVLFIGVKAPPRLAATWAASDALRAQLVPQPGDAALLAKLQRATILLVVFGIPIAAAALPALILLVWAAAEWLPKTEWLVLLFLILMTPVAAAQVTRRWRQRRQVG